MAQLILLQPGVVNSRGSSSLQIQVEARASLSEGRGPVKTCSGWMGRPSMTP